MLKDARTYEHVPPETVGNARKILVSDQAGRSNLLARLADAASTSTPRTRASPSFWKTQAARISRLHL